MILKKVIKIMVFLMLNVGFCEGCLIYVNIFFLRVVFRVWIRFMVVVFLFLLRGVGVILNIIKNLVILIMYIIIVFLFLYF